MLPSVMFAASSTQFDFKPKSVDADLGKCAFLITHAEALPNGYYKICAESLNLQNSGIWTLTSEGTTIYVSSSSEKSFCINTSVLQGTYTLTFEVDGQICFQSYNSPIVDTDCPLFPFGPMGICDSTVMLDSVFLEKTVGHPFVYKFNDGSGGVKTSNLDLELPDGATEICITYSLPGSERLTTCCYNIHINECCNTADFDFKIKEVEGIAISRSCLNPEYEIISHCTNNDGFHKWEASLTAAEYGHLRQSIYKAIKENPAWLSASVVLDDFYTEEQSSFIGQSIMISDSLEGFEYRIAQQQNILQPYQDSIRVLQADADGLNELLVITADLDSINMILTMLQNIDSSMMQLSHQAELLSMAFQTYNDTTLSHIRTLNNSLSVASD